MTHRKKPIPGRSDPVSRWVQSLPAFWRPVAYGAGFIAFVMGLRGAAIVLPIGLVLLRFTSNHPMTDIAKVVLILVLAIVGGGLAGLAYSVAGRWARAVPLVGPYLAGWLTVAPYIVMVDLLVRLVKNQPVWAPFGAVDYFVAGLLIPIFGTQLGYMMFRTSDSESAAAEPHA